LQLSSSVGLDDNALDAPLVSLVDALQAAVPSFRGLHLTIVDDFHPVSLTAFLRLDDGDSIDTSLRVRFAALGPGFGSESQVVFYAAAPGAFVDLAADFGYALGKPIMTPNTPAGSNDSADGDGQGGRGQTGSGQSLTDDNRDRLIVLDADLPPSITESGLVGMDERSMIDRALGVLIDQGHHPDAAHATLRRYAADAGVEPHIYATQLLRH
jgi:hypothetical protein